MKIGKAYNIAVDSRKWINAAIRAKNYLFRKGVSESQRDYSPSYIRDEGRHDDFPDYWTQIVYSSPIASAAYMRLAQFVGGKGFVQQNLGNRKINETQTLHELHLKLIDDFALFGRMAIRVITSRAGKVISLEHLPAEWIRYEFPNRDGKIRGCWCMPFINSTEDKMRDAYYMPLYNPGQKASETLEQIAEASEHNARKQSAINEESDGYYYGHIYFYNSTSPISRVYSRPMAYPAEKDILADGRVSQSIERITANAFLSPGALVVPGDPNEAAYEDGRPETNYKTKAEILNDELSESLAGSPNAGAITVFWKGPGDDTPAFIPFQNGNLHELFTATDTMLTQRICIAFGMPQVLVGVKQPGSLGENQQMRDSIKYANESTARLRRRVEQIYSELLKDIQGFNTRNGVEIMKIQDWSDLPDNIFASLTASQKDAYLSEEYNIKPDPAGREQAPAIPQPTPDTNNPETEEEDGSTD